MRFKSITTVASALTILNGFFFFLLPELSLMLLERYTDLVGIMQTQLAGACAIGLGVMTWFSRNTNSREVRTIVLSGNFCAFGLFIFIDFLGASKGVNNHFGWLILIADVLIFLGIIASAFTYRGNKK